MGIALFASGLLSLAFLSPSVSAVDFTITTSANFDTGTKGGTVTDTDWDNIDAGELRMGTSAGGWERWKNEGQTSGVAIGDLSGTEYRRAIKLNHTGEFILYGFAVYIISITGSPNDIYVALLEPDGADGRPNGVSGVLVETSKVARGDITTGAYNYFNFTNPVVINQTAANWLALLTDGTNPTNGYYLIYDNTVDQGFRESLQSAMVGSTDGGASWGNPTYSSGIQTKVLTVNYTTSATWESDTIAIPSGSRLDSLDITFDSRFAQHEYRADNNASHYTNATWPTSVGPPNEGQSVHPDIVDIGSVWNNYRYWACSTPYPAGVDDDEWPEVVGSNDTLTFEFPSGSVVDPIWVSGETVDHAGDCEIIYDGTYLRAYWFYPNNTYNRAYILSKRSSDGINWVPSGNGLDNAIEVLNLTFDDGKSPSIVYDSPNYYLWYIESDSDGADANDTYIHYRTSTDGENFSADTNITSGFSVMTDTEFNIWHFDMEKVGDEYWGLFAMFHNHSTVGGTKSAFTELYFGWSTDRENWTVQAYYPIIHQGADTVWDEREIYRSTFLMIGDTMRIWYSAANDAGAWWISRTDATIQTRSITQVDFKADNSIVAYYLTDIETGTTLTIDDPETGNFDPITNCDLNLYLSFSSSGTATPIISSIEGTYESYTPSMGTQVGLGATFEVITIGDDTAEFKPEPIGRYGNTTLFYYWEFSDGSTSNEKTPTKTFNYPGITQEFSATLTICNEDHCTHPVERDFKLIRWWMIILILAAIITPVILGMWCVERKRR